MMDLPGRLVLLGHPVEHSLSPRFQAAALRAAGIDLEYEAVDVAPGELARMAHLLLDISAAGNVTSPYKEAFVACCGRLSPVAHRTGAVNTFWTEDGMLVGDNTDVGGFDAAIRSTVGAPQPGAVVAILGAGGGASGVLAAVERWEGVQARVWSRTMVRAERLVERYARIARAEWSVEAAVQGAALVVNATPVGRDDTALPIEVSLLDSTASTFDLVYKRGETAWVHACRGRGLKASDGLPMVVEQGALAFQRWFGIVPDRAAMLEACR